MNRPEFLGDFPVWFHATADAGALIERRAFETFRDIAKERS